MERSLNDTQNDNNENDFSFSDQDVRNATFLAYYDAVSDKMVKKEHKCCIFLGGQPGSGKSTMVKEIDPADEFVHVDLDRYRRYHPYYDQICERYQEKAQEYTNQFAYLVKQGIIQNLSDAGYNFIIDGTLRDAESQIETALELHEKNYSIQADVICTKPEISSIRTDLRYEVQMKMYHSYEGADFPRAVGDDYHDMVCKHLPNSLEKLQNALIPTGEPLFDKITFHHSDQRKPVVIKHDGTSAKQYLENFYESAFTEGELSAFHDDVRKTISYKESRNAADLSHFIQKEQLLEKRIGVKSKTDSPISKDNSSVSNKVSPTSAYQQTLAAFEDLGLDNDFGIDYDYEFK